MLTQYLTRRLFPERLQGVNEMAGEPPSQLREDCSDDPPCSVPVDVDGHARETHGGSISSLPREMMSSTMAASPATCTHYPGPVCLSRDSNPEMDRLVSRYCIDSLHRSTNLVLVSMGSSGIPSCALSGISYRKLNCIPTRMVVEFSSGLLRHTCRVLPALRFSCSSHINIATLYCSRDFKHTEIATVL